MAYKVIILYRLYMPSYFLGTFTEYPFLFFYIFLIPTEPSTHVHHELPEPMPAQYRQFLKDPK